MPTQISHAFYGGPGLGSEPAAYRDASYVPTKRSPLFVKWALRWKLVLDGMKGLRVVPLPTPVVQKNSSSNVSQLRVFYNDFLLLDLDDYCLLLCVVYYIWLDASLVTPLFQQSTSAHCGDLLDNNT